LVFRVSNISELIEFVNAMGESRNYEFKASISWNDDHQRFKLTKSIMSLSNIANGGLIILGVDQTSNHQFKPNGMTKEHYDSFNYDNMRDHVNNYASPYAEFNIQKLEDNNIRFVIIDIQEFEMLPVTCKRQYFVKDENYPVMKEGDMFTRTRNKPESTKVISYLDMDEIIKLAVDKGVSSFLKRLGNIGIVNQLVHEPDKTFEKRLKDFE
jgi:predicted HTH transcriptional regulator